LTAFIGDWNAALATIKASLVVAKPFQADVLAEFDAAELEDKAKCWTRSGLSPTTSSEWLV
jgi:hypothetical protein